MKKVTILITGSNGFIGRELTRYLLSNPMVDNNGEGIIPKLILVDDLSNSKFPMPAGAFPMSLETYAETYLLPDEDGNIPHTPDIVIHLAAQTDVRKSMHYPFEDFHRNVGATVNLLDCLRIQDFKGLFLFTSTGGAIYPDDRSKEFVSFKEEDVTESQSSVYGFNKRIGEKYIQKFSENMNMDVTILRLANLYGPGAGKGVIDCFSSSMRSNEPTLVLNGGAQTRDYLFISDLCKLIFKLVLTKAKKDPYLFEGIYNVGTGEETSLTALYETIKYFFPEWEGGALIGDYKEGEVLRSALDCSKLQEALRETPDGELSFTSLKQGVATTIHIDMINSKIDFSSEEQMSRILKYSLLGKKT